MKTFKILMCSKPGGDRGPGLTFSHHVDALNQHTNIECDEIWKYDEVNLEIANQYDIFWFYAKGFDPNLYLQLKHHCPDKKFVFGPNVLLDYPDYGPHDTWDKWFVENVDFDLYIDQVEFYNNHVKKFLRKELICKADYLDKCVTFDIDPLLIENKNIKYDCLIYSKKRRYDDNYLEFHDDLIDMLEDNNISYTRVHYGEYNRQEYFDKLLQSKCCVNLSLDECPGIATYEAMFLDVPIIGSPHNTPSIFDQRFWVHNTDRMTDLYLKRNEGSAKAYFDKINEFLSGKLQTEETPREYILRHAGYKRYADDAYVLLNKYC